MRITVSPDFPDSQPYVDIIHAIANRFTDRLMHRSILLGKLATLEVSLEPLHPNQEQLDAVEARKAKIRELGDSVPRIIYEATMKETAYDFLKSGGYCAIVWEQGFVFHRIVLNIVPHEHYLQFADIVAHEMGHMLFQNTFNYLNACEPTEAGSVPSGSSLRRMDPASGRDYGHMLEEAVVCALAGWLTADLPLPPQVTQREFEKGDLAALGNLMADAFGAPLKELRYLDEFDETQIFNPFWYAAAAGRFGWVITRFEELMGSGSYERLCSLLDVEKEAEFEQARQILREFAEKAAEDDS